MGGLYWNSGIAEDWLDGGVVVEGGEREVQKTFVGKLEPVIVLTILYWEKRYINK